MLVFDVDNAAKVYPRQRVPANTSISLQIHRGEIYGLLGDSGAGKTTLVRQTLALLRPTSGKIKLFDAEISTRPVHTQPAWTQLDTCFLAGLSDWR